MSQHVIIIVVVARWWTNTIKKVSASLWIVKRFCKRGDRTEFEADGDNFGFSVVSKCVDFVRSVIRPRCQLLKRVDNRFVLSSGEKSRKSQFKL
jgi:hypothetical protein